MTTATPWLDLTNALEQAADAIRRIFREIARNLSIWLDAWMYVIAKNLREYQLYKFAKRKRIREKYRKRLLRQLAFQCTLQ